VEVEAFAIANLVAKIEAGLLDAAPVWTDIKTFDGRPFRKRVHIITAGYPCQPFSVAGKRKGTADPRHLWPHIKRAVRCIEQPYCFFENVSGHLNIGFQTVYEDLVKLGYSVEAGLFTAAEIGAPHRRKRLFILAHCPNSGCEDVQIQQAGQSTSGDGCRGMADTECPEQGQGTIQEAQAEIGRDRFAIDRWPARSGQPQYEWEEPRVVDNARHRRHKPQKGQIQTGRDSVEHADKGQAQSRLGRAVNGTSSRVDRLRLLGNGVVPQQAEKAFRTLFFEANR